MAARPVRADGGNTRLAPPGADRASRRADARTRDAAAPVVHRIHAERVLLLAWGRAILLQLAHPLVAAGVDDHSGFHRQRYGGLHRLRRTLDAMLALTYDTPEAPRAARRINATHDRVRGTLREGTPVFPPGTPYAAHDPELLRWVHATLIDSFLLVYQRFVAPLSPEEIEAYCYGTHVLESVLGAPEGFFPRSRAELDAYLQRMEASGVIHVTDTARRLARLILWPDAPLPIRPAGIVTRLVTVGTLPPAIRAAYGLRWSARDEQALCLLAWGIRHALPVVPAPLRYWPVARQVLATHRTPHLAPS
ncbi:MAG: oxygenase MpaB family protein [Sphaerobacter sp.]|nr:oxygenase MpaB family protein [Sphaerobacter sp.]